MSPGAELEEGGRYHLHAVARYSIDHQFMVHRILSDRAYFPVFVSDCWLGNAFNLRRNRANRLSQQAMVRAPRWIASLRRRS
jgi:hypothetical protein